MAADDAKRGLDDRYVLELLMQSYSLNELFGILESICENIDERYINPNLKNSRYFNITFFGVLARARSLLEKMLFRTEVLRRTMPEFSGIHESLLEYDKALSRAHALVSDNNMIEGRVRIIEAARMYPAILGEITGILIDAKEAREDAGKEGAIK